MNKSLKISLMALILAGILIGPALTLADETATPTPTATSTVTPTPTSTKHPKATPRPVDVVCIQSAIEKRDSAMISALNIYNSAVITALTTRKEALKTAWAATENRKEALRKAWTDFRTSSKAIAKTLKSSKSSAWNQFYADRKACKSNYADEPSGGQGEDAKL